LHNSEAVGQRHTSTRVADAKWDGRPLRATFECLPPTGPLWRGFMQQPPRMTSVAEGPLPGGFRAREKHSVERLALSRRGDAYQHRPARSFRVTGTRPLEISARRLRGGESGAPSLSDARNSSFTCVAGTRGNSFPCEAGLFVGGAGARRRTTPGLLRSEPGCAVLGGRRLFQPFADHGGVGVDAHEP
jgi:hypothetical protein